jgi:hypothetical protein
MSTTHTEKQQQDPWIPGTEVCSRLLELTGQSPGWRRLLTLAADGKLPMMTRRDGRWWGVYQSKLPALAEALDLTVAA